MGKVLYIVRHCHAEGQSPNAKLTVEGRQQAKALVRFFIRRMLIELFQALYCAQGRLPG